jgi:hypothetical protein
MNDMIGFWPPRILQPIMEDTEQPVDQDAFSMTALGR